MNFQIFTKLLVVLYLIFLSNIAKASGSATGSVNYVLITQPNILFFALDINTTNPAPCSTQNQWAINLDNGLGKAILATVLFAKTTGSKISVAGTGQCNIWPDRETPTWVLIKD